jgi:hypothetical protein
MTVLASLAGLLLFGGAVACGLTGGALCTLAPVARLARGLAIAGLTLGVLELAQSATLVHWFALVSEGLPMPVTGYTRGAGLAYFVMPLLFTGLLETARLTVLALFWRALCVVLRDGTGALLGLRLAYAIPAAQGVLLLLGLVFGFFGGIGRGGESIVLVVGLVIQIGLLVWGVIVAERVWRRLRAVVPPA